MTSPVVARILAKAVVPARIRATIALAADGDDGVERPAPGAAPTAFRIWKSGENPTSKGMTVFSRRSAELLLAEQAERGNLYSIDVDHMSLSDAAPPEHHRAVGWHRIEVRESAEGPELWATDVEWTTEVRAALESQPPGFRYFSPAYDVERETGEVVGYLNTALTNNPATYQVTALATRAAEQEKQPMKMDDILAALKAAAEGDDEAQAKKAKAALAALGAGEDEPKGEPDGDEPKKDAEGEDEPKKGEPAGDEEPKKDAIAASASVIAAQDARIRKLEADNAAFRKEREDAERKSLIASREVSAELAKALAGKPIAVVREICSALPAKSIATRSTETVQATRGGSADGAGRLPPEEANRLAVRMGLRASEARIGWDPNMKTTRVFPALAGLNAAKKEG